MLEQKVTNLTIEKLTDENKRFCQQAVLWKVTAVDALEREKNIASTHGTLRSPLDTIMNGYVNGTTSSCFSTRKQSPLYTQTTNKPATKNKKQFSLKKTPKKDP